MIERSIAFGPDDGLVGTLCLPDGEPGVEPAVGQILFNAGVLHRIGPHRLNVRLARKLAHHGIPSIRFDLSGHGDSAPPSSVRASEEQAVIDLGHAMDTLGAASGVGRFSLLGFCSGSVHSFASALADARVAGIVLHDTFSYPTARSRWNRYRRRIRQYGLREAVSGWIRARTRTLGRVIGRLGGSSGLWPLTGGSDYIHTRKPTKAEFAGRIRRLHDRGVEVHIVYSGESDIYNYREQFNDAFRGLGIMEFVTVEYFPEMDHSVTLLSWQADFMRGLETWTVALDEECRKAGPASDRSSTASPR